jgi:hypothetical protein
MVDAAGNVWVWLEVGIGDIGPIIVPGRRQAPSRTLATLKPASAAGTTTAAATAAAAAAAATQTALLL